MEKIEKKMQVFNEALDTLNDAIHYFNEHEISLVDESGNKRAALAARDSLIQRFEYCTDLFWKLLKIYLEDIEKVNIEINSPRGVIRETVLIKTITEGEGETCMEMVISRNKTSHIYHQEIAEVIAAKVPKFYKLMKDICNKVYEKKMINE